MSTLSRVASIKSVCDQLHRERNLKRLVEKFKESSAVDRFRTKAGIYEDTVRRLAAAKRFRWIEEILEEQKRYRDISKEGFAVRIISLYGKSGMYDSAQKLFDEMPDLRCDRTVLSFNAILSACVNSKKFDRIEGLFRELPGRLSVDPDLVSYNIAIKGFCEVGSFEPAVSMLDEMEKKGVLPDLVTFNTLLNGFYGKGKVDDGQRIWQRMDKNGIVPDIRSYNAKLLGLASVKKMKEAAETFNEMRNKEIKPDIFSFNSLLKGYTNDGNLEEVKFWYGELEKSERSPNKATFTMLIPFACDKGDLGFAFKLSEDVFITKCLVDAAILQTLVDSLVKEKKDEEANKLVQLGKSNNYCNYKLKLP